MRQFLAVAGKGGTGKTTISSLMVAYLLGQAAQTILVIDADPNANLNSHLGIEIAETIGDLIEKSKKMPADRLPAGMTRDRYLELKLQESLLEEKGFDFLAMGKPEGPGCYCYTNSLLAAHLERLSKNYQYIVMDNEAGMEHLSRRTARKIDLLFLISDPTITGIKTVGRLAELAGKMQIITGKAGVVINRLPGELPPVLESEIAKLNLPLWGKIPEDPRIPELELKEESLFALPPDSPAKKAVFKMMKSLLSL